MTTAKNNVTHLPSRCRCQGDSATWADTSACSVHDLSTSPLSQAVQRVYEEGRVASKAAWYEEALRTICGPADRGPFVDVYRCAGGGYEGLQAIAKAALNPGFSIGSTEVPF